MKQVKTLWTNVPEGWKRTLHTLWQVAVPVLLTHLVIAKSSADVKSAFVVAGAAVLAAVKAKLVGQL